MVLCLSSSPVCPQERLSFSSPSLPSRRLMITVDYGSRGTRFTSSSVTTLLTMMFIISSMGVNTISRSRSLSCGIGFSVLTCLIRLRREPLVDLRHGQSKHPKMSNFSFFGTSLSLLRYFIIYSLENYCNLSVYL